MPSLPEPGTNKARPAQRAKHGNGKIYPPAMVGSNGHAVRLTDLQREFIRQFVDQNVCPTEAARLAGSDNPGSFAHRTLQLPHVQQAIRVYQGKLVTEVGTIGLHRLKDMLRDDKLSGTPLVQAVRIAMQVSGHLDAASRKVDDERKPDDLSVEELQQVMDRLNQAAAALPPAIIDQPSNGHDQTQ